MSYFQVTHVIKIEFSSGAVTSIEVDAGLPDLTALPPGTGVALYTRLESESCLPADWEYAADEGLLFQGSEVLPFLHATYSIERVANAPGGPRGVETPG